MRRRTNIAIAGVLSLALSTLAHAEAPPPARPIPAPAPPAPPPSRPPTPPPLTNAGYLCVYSTPWARVHIDGKDTGRTTPITPRSRLTLAAGNHKIMFVVATAGGDEKFTFTITIKPGETLKLHKQLPVRGTVTSPVRTAARIAPSW
jgi:hypothetical protein